MVTPVPDHMDFPAEEQKILQLWKEIDAFQTCLKQSKDRPKYTFYDGPPFATGLPHYGHILAGTIKDVVTRYAHQSGFHVARRFGWDCHGLPVEYEIDKTLGIKSHEDVEKMGVANYNAECRKIVMRYSSEWENIVTRMGRWIDFKNDYKTLYPWFMESIWWVFRQIYDKGLVYRGWKIMPFSTSCHTPLSNFEAGQNYKDVQDPAIIVNFPLDEDPSVSIIAWTTTPWTLPSNLSLCVHPDFTYIKVKDNAHDQVYIMLRDRLGALFKTEEEYTILEEMKGESLVGKKYKPLFDYFADMKSSEPDTGAFRVISDTYVTSDSGTGVVHQAPGFGEDDLRACIHYGVVAKGESVVCPVDYSGCFTDEVVDFKGQYVKDADKGIMKMLKEKGRMVHQSTITHSYPFCWRSETPLIYRAVPSWFIRVEMIVQQLLENNNKCYWVPEFVQAKRFANWLTNARDWAVSRNRYWGTPIPIWASDDFSEVVCVGSVEELEQLSGVRVSDLHRENVDHITIPSCRGNGVLKRVSEVFDCWFESGSMPYAQSHYPFENKKVFETTFPADFIAEGVDQTRGWFYTLLVVSTALFNKPPYKNLIVNGLVLASNGQKMSKRLKNYPDPMNVVKDYGADALRLYLVNSPVVRAESLRFQEKGVKDVVKDVFLPWFNAYRFLIQNVLRLKQEEGISFVHTADFSPANTMDRWIISFTQSLVFFMKEEMASEFMPYLTGLYTVVPRLVKFIDQLTNWYVRSNRKRIKGELGKHECLDSMHTLFSVLYSMTRMLAPFTPFLTEHMFQNLRHLLPWELNDSNASLHYIMMPKPRPDLIDKEIERAVSLMQSVVETGRYIRDKVVVPIKFPLPEVVVIHRDPGSHDDLKKLENYILEELNVKVLTLATEDSKYGVQLQAEPDSERLGKRLKGDFKRVAPAIKALSNEQLVAFQNEGTIEVESHELTVEDIKISYAVAESLSSRYHAHASGTLLVLLDATPSQEMVDEGVAREVINKIQKLRKKAGLQPRDAVEVLYKVGGEGGGASLTRVIENHREYIETTTKGPVNPWTSTSDLSHKIVEEEQKMKGLADVMLHLWIIPKPESSSGTNSIPLVDPVPNGDGPIPVCRYVNLVLFLPPGPTLRPAGLLATLLLENPVGENILTLNQLKTEVCNLLKSYLNRDLHIWVVAGGNTEPVTSSCDLLSLHRQTLYISEEPLPVDCGFPPTEPLTPFSKFVDVTLDNGRQATVMLENPKGVKIIAEKDAKIVAKQLF